MPALAAATTFVGCTNMTPQQQGTVTGTAIGAEVGQVLTLTINQISLVALALVGVVLLTEPWEGATSVAGIVYAILTNGLGLGKPIDFSGIANAAWIHAIPDGLGFAEAAALPVALHAAPATDDTAQKVNARLSSMLQYVLCVSRFAHCIKLMGRDMVGSNRDPDRLFLYRCNRLSPRNTRPGWSSPPRLARVALSKQASAR